MIGTAEERFWAKVDRSGDCWLWTGGRAGGYGYGYFWVNGRVIPAHRFAYELMVGPAGPELDHRITCPKNCVTPEHLRPATRKQNSENVTVRSDSSSGVRGVSWHEPLKKWRAYVRHNGRMLHLGYFTDLDKAGEVARDKRNELFTHNDADRD